MIWLYAYLCTGVVAALLSYEDDDTLREKVLGVVCAVIFWPVMLLVGMLWGDEL